MSHSEIGHSIRWHRRGGGEKDRFYTPQTLVALHVEKVMMFANPDDLWLDPCSGDGRYLRAFPTSNKEWCEIDAGVDFGDYEGEVDVICSNPPYSMIDMWLEKSVSLNPKTISYLLAFHSVTARRLERMEQWGYGLVDFHLTKVFQWYGMSVIATWVKDGDSVLSYDRVVHRDEN